MSEAGSILRHGQIYTVANVINRAAGLALIPLYTHVLSPGDFGLYAIVQSVGELAAILFGLGFTGAMNRFYLEYPHDEAMQKRVVSTAFLALAGVGALTALLAYPLSRVASQWIFGDAQNAPLFAVTFIGLLFLTLFEIEGSYLVVRKRSWSYLWLSCAKAAALVAANLLFVWHWRLGVFGVVLATVVALGTLSLIFGTVVLKRVGLGFSAPLCRRLFGFGLPMVPSAMAQAGIAVVERYFLNTLAGAAAVGLYSLASRLASLLQMFVAAPFAQTFAVRRVETLVKGEPQDVYNRILLLFTLLMCSCGLFLSVFAHDLIALIAPGDYADAALIVPWLALAFVLAALGFNFELGLHFTKYTRVLPLINGVALLLAVVANALLIPHFGLLGCALALALVNAVRLALTVALNLRFGSAQIHLDWWRAMPLMALFTAAGLVAVHTGLPPLQPQWLLLKLLAIVSLVAVVACSPLLDAASREELRAAWRQMRVRHRPG